MSDNFCKLQEEKLRHYNIDFAVMANDLSNALKFLGRKQAIEFLYTYLQGIYDQTQPDFTYSEIRVKGNFGGSKRRSTIEGKLGVKPENVLSNMSGKYKINDTKHEIIVTLDLTGANPPPSTVHQEPSEPPIPVTVWVTDTE